jgi:hypothetical protein
MRSVPPGAVTLVGNFEKSSGRSGSGEFDSAAWSL